MNRRQRRAAQTGPGRSNKSGPESAPPDVLQLCTEASWQQQRGLLDDAVRLYRRALALKPDFAPALNNLGCCYLAQGKLERAADTFGKLVLTLPELLDSYSDVLEIMTQVNPSLRTALTRAAAAWPNLPSATDLFGSQGIAAIAQDPLLHQIIQTVPVRNVDLERLMTAARTAVLREACNSAAARPDDAMLAFCCALAQQSFINEYVFAISEAERTQVMRLGEAVAQRLAAKDRIPPLWIAALACYTPLHEMPDAAALLDRKWPEVVDHLLTQQVREIAEQQADLPAIPRLTPVDDDVSIRVREQYEENPYPRWVLPPSMRPPTDINAFLRAECPGVAFRDLPSASPDILIAGCGTGQQSIGMARLIKNVRVLAIDLSLQSLAHARRKTRELGLDNVEYGQADILQLGHVGRTFDVIDASGVLHHMADPLVAWRALLSLLRPDGVMKLGLYSEVARRPVAEARAFIAERGYRSNADDIRRCRQEIAKHAAFGEFANMHDFYSLSECRDLLFHVQEHRLTIPQIKSFLDAEQLRFLGFKVVPAVRAQYAKRFPEDHTMTDLGRWAAFEEANPGTFRSMYQFWLQRS